VFLLYFIAGSGVFTVRAVSAPNLRRKEMSQVIALCNCLGKNIFLVRPDDIKKHLEQIPSLVVTRVYTSLPNKLYVDATYKKRVAIWRTPEAAYAVAADGEVLQVWKLPFPKRAWKGLPVFEEGYDSSLKQGHRLLVGEHVSVSALTMARSLRSRVTAQLRPLVKAYLYRPYSGITMIGRADWWALFGMDSSSALDVRIASLQFVLATKSSPLTPGKCIDLRQVVPGHSIVDIHPDHNCG
jgi:hypothetical protein